MSDLLDLQAKWTQTIKDLATSGQSYTFPGRSFTRADADKARQMLFLVNQAIALATRSARQIAQARIDTQSTFDP